MFEFFILASPDSSKLIQPPSTPNNSVSVQSKISPFNFQPKKFFPTSQDINYDQNIKETKSNDENIGIAAKWLPESVNEINEQPHYKSVKPILSRTVTPNPNH